MMQDNSTPQASEANEAYLADLPQFMRPYRNPLAPGKVEWVDGWVVESSGDVEMDRIIGEAYAIEVARKAGKYQNPSLVTFAISCIIEKSRVGALTSECAIEHAFISKLASMACAGVKN